MASQNLKLLHWTQRIALVRYNIHSARQSGNFGFFKGLQVADLMEGTNHAATLGNILGDDADETLAALDNINAGLALAHEDAFEKVFEKLKTSMDCDEIEEVVSKYHVDVATHRDITNVAIDKHINAAIALINQLAVDAQDEAANVWITGTTITADCIEVTLQEMHSLHIKIDDYIRLEESRNIVKASAASAIAGLKGIFSLMEPSDPQNGKISRSMSMASIASAGSSVFRRVSNAFQSTTTSRMYGGTVPSSPTVPVSPTKSMHHNFNHARNNNWHSGDSSNAPIQDGFSFHKLSMVPATPAFEEPDPFDTSRGTAGGDMPPSRIGTGQEAVAHTAV